MFRPGPHYSKPEIGDAGCPREHSDVPRLAMPQELRFRVWGLGVFPLILTALNRDYNRTRGNIPSLGLRVVQTSSAIPKASISQRHPGPLSQQRLEGAASPGGRVLAYTLHPKP